MRYTFRVLRPVLGLLVNDLVTLDSDHRDRLEVTRYLQADADAFMNAFLDGSLRDEFVARPAEEVEQLAQIVANLPSQPRRRSGDDGPHLVR